MKRAHFDKLCKKLEQWEITEESLGMIRLTTKFRKLMIKNLEEDKVNESIILSVLEVIGTVEHNELADYCCIIKGSLPNAL